MDSAELNHLEKLAFRVLHHLGAKALQSPAGKAHSGTMEMGAHFGEPPATVRRACQLLAREDFLKALGGYQGNAQQIFSITPKGVQKLQMILRNNLTSLYALPMPERHVENYKLGLEVLKAAEEHLRTPGESTVHTADLKVAAALQGVDTQQLREACNLLVRLGLLTQDHLGLNEFTLTPQGWTTFHRAIQEGWSMLRVEPAPGVNVEVARNASGNINVGVGTGSGTVNATQHVTSATPQEVLAQLRQLREVLDRMPNERMVEVARVTVAEAEDATQAGDLTRTGQLMLTLLTVVGLFASIGADGPEAVERVQNLARALGVGP